MYSIYQTSKGHFYGYDSRKHQGIEGADTFKECFDKVLAWADGDPEYWSYFHPKDGDNTQIMPPIPLEELNTFKSNHLEFFI